MPLTTGLTDRYSLKLLSISDSEPNTEVAYFLISFSANPQSRCVS